MRTLKMVDSDGRKLTLRSVRGRASLEIRLPCYGHVYFDPAARQVRAIARWMSAADKAREKWIKP